MKKSMVRLMSAASLLLAAPSFAQNYAKIDVVAKFQKTRPASVVITSTGRTIVTMHPLDAPKLRIVELNSKGMMTPFPNMDWADGPEKGSVGLSATIAMRIDKNDVVWILDMGGPKQGPQIVAWDTRKNMLFKQMSLPASVVRKTSFLQDFALDEAHGTMVIADMTFPPEGVAPQPAFIVVDLQTGKARRVLEGYKIFMPVSHEVVVEGSKMATLDSKGKTLPHLFGLNPIAIDPENKWIYFGTVNGNSVYRIPAASLADPMRKDADLAKEISYYAKKTPSDGITAGRDGKIFVTDIEHNAIGVTTAKDGYRILAQDKMLAWPDGLYLHSDGWLYATQNQLHHHPALNENVDESVPPYHIVRIKP